MKIYRVGGEWEASGRRVGGEWEASGRRVGGEWETSGSQVGGECERSGRRVGAELFHTDKQTNMTKQIVVFRNFEETPPPHRLLKLSKNLIHF